MSQFSSVLRQAIIASGVPIARIADETGMSRTTVAAKTNGQIPLDPQRNKDVLFASRVCEVIGADLNSVLAETERLDEQERSSSGFDPAIADVLMDVLEDDRATPERKLVVRETLKKWIARAAM